MPLIADPPQIATAYLATLVGAPGNGARLVDLLRRADCLGADDTVPERLDMVAFWRACARNILATNDESHGLADPPVPRGSLAVLITTAKEADTLAEALRRLVDTTALVRHEVRLTVRRSRSALRLSVLPVRAGEPRAEVYGECFALVIHCALRWMTGRALDPVQVRGASAVAPLGDDLLAALHAPVTRHGEGVTIAYALADADAPVLVQKYQGWGEAEFASFTAMLGQRAPAPAGDTATRVAALFAKGQFEQDAIAQALGLSVATLRRRLAGDGTSFRALSGQWRTARLKDLLASDLPLAAIAEALGLSDERSLRRFAHDHLAMPPARFRLMT